MFSASVTVAQLLDSVIDGIGLFLPQDRAFYRDTLNECLCRLYTELIAEVRSMNVFAAGDLIQLSSLSPIPDAAPIREQDVCGVSATGKRLYYLPPAQFDMRDDRGFYTVQDGAVRLSLPDLPRNNLALFYLVCPMHFNADNEDTPVPFPDEFLPLLRAKLRGEAFRLANEDALAAKWLGEYNTLLDEFRLYLETVSARRGGQLC